MADLPQQLLEFFVVDGDQTKIINLIQQNPKYNFNYYWALGFAHSHQQKETAKWLVNNCQINCEILSNVTQDWLRKNNIYPTQQIIVSD